MKPETLSSVITIMTAAALTLLPSHASAAPFYNNPNNPASIETRDESIRGSEGELIVREEAHGVGAEVEVELKARGADSTTEGAKDWIIRVKREEE